MIKEIREQPETVINACRGRLRRAEATASVRRSEPLGPPAPPRAPGRLRGVRHELARGPRRRVPDRAARPSARRGRIRQRVPLSQRTARRSDAGLRAQPVGRDGRHPGRPPRGEAPRAPDPGDRQHRRQHHRPRGRRRHLSPRRPRGRRRQHQGVLGAGHRARSCWPSISAGSGTSRSRTAWPSSTRSNRSPACSARSSRPSRSIEQAAERFAPARSALYLGRDLHFPGRARGGPQAQGDQLHPRRGLSDRRDETRADRAGRPRDSVRLRGPPRLAARQDAEQYRGGPGPQRHRSSPSAPRATTPSPRCPTSSCRSPTRPRSSSRSWPSSRSSCWPTTSPAGAAAISTSRATWPRA